LYSNNFKNSIGLKKLKKLIIGLIKLMFYMGIFVFAFSIFWVLAYKIMPPPATPIMFIRLFEGSEGINKQWKSYENISPNLFKAVIAAEDARFFEHKGIDWDAVEDAKKYNAKHKGKKKRGASTITMQTAKNAFLWHGRNWARKGMEVYFTYLIELVWGKKRILEIYVNIIEFGDGLYGAEAASQEYFGKSASKLTKREAALLAAVLPNPRRWNPAKPTAYINSRAGTIQARMNAVSLKSITE